jgi:hypothetical protein
VLGELCFVVVGWLMVCGDETRTPL